jgi:ribosomal protein L29
MAKKMDIRDQSEEQMKFRLQEIDKELFGLRNELASAHKIEKPHLLKALKKEKAQILTILSEKLGGKNAKK